MLCPKCRQENRAETTRCVHCGAGMALASLELVRGNLPERVHFLSARSYSLGRGTHNDLTLAEPSVSKSHARVLYEGERFWIEDAGSLHGVYVNATKVQKAELSPGCQVQLGNLTFKFAPLNAEGTTDRLVEFPWVQHQQLLLSLVQALNSTLVLSEVLEQVLDGVMRITKAERGFLLLADSGAGSYPSVAGLLLRVGRRRGGAPISEVQGLSSSVIRRAIDSGETVATGNAVDDPSLGSAPSVILMDLRTIVCIPLRSPRGDSSEGGDRPKALGALYVDNPETSAPFPPDSLRAAEALARHAALAIENAQLFEREQRTIEELRLAQKQLLQSEKLASIGQMAAGIAHELNTPLTYIMGNLEMLQMQELSESQREMLASVDKGVARIKTLAQSLLAFSRPADESLAPLDLNEVAERALEFCHYQTLKAGLRVEKALAPALPHVAGVASQLEMAIINLIVNAAHAMQGRPERVLSVSTAREEGAVAIRVSDTGPGIPADIQSTLFEPFVTTKAEGHGTGLGLSTVLMIVERHHGRITFETREDAGTTFTIRLPPQG